MKQWEKLTKEQIQQAIDNSYTYSEALIQMGYAGRKENYYIINECADKYNISISHLTKGKKQKWQNFSKQEIIDIIQNSKSYKEAVRKLGYKSKDSSMNYKIDELSKMFNIDLSHFTKTGNLIGQQFGKLKVIALSDKRDSSGNRYYQCQCNCSKNTIITVSACDLRSGHTQSCGCSRSHGEVKIANILEQLQIDFIKEYSYEDLKSNKNKKLRFDFYLPEYNTLIEFQGRQHYENTGGFFDELFEELVERDKMKKEYCKNNNIKLIEIPYSDYDILNKDYLLHKIKVSKLILQIIFFKILLNKRGRL